MDNIIVALDPALVQGKVEKLEGCFEDVIICDPRSSFRSVVSEQGSDTVALMVGAQEKVDADLIESLPQLAIVGTLSTGTEHLDLELLSSKGVHVIDARGINAGAVAEHALMLMLAGLKTLIAANDASWDGRERAGLPHLPFELRGQKVGIIGAGDTARSLIDLLAPFGCTVQVWTRDPDGHRDLESRGVEFVDLETLFERCSAISVHVALADETKGLVSGHLLDRLPQHAVLVNTSRIAVMDASAVERFLLDRPDVTLAIDGLGVRDTFGIGLREHLLATPHVAGVTAEVAPRMRDHVVDAIVQRRNGT